MNKCFAYSPISTLQNTEITHAAATFRTEGFVLFALAVLLALGALYRHFHSKLQKMAEEHAKERENGNRLNLESALILNSIEEALIVTDSAGIIVKANHAAERLTGYSGEELRENLLNRQLRFVSGIDGLPLPSPVETVLKTGTALDGKEYTELIAKDGVRKQISDTAYPIRDSYGRVSGAVLILRDVTAENRGKEQLSEALDALKITASVTNSSYFQTESPERPLPLVSAGVEPCGCAFEENWAHENGSPLPVEKWIHPDDLEYFVRQWKKISEKTVNKLEFTYHSLYRDKVRRFRMLAKTVGDHRERVHCVIQDISDSGEKERELENLKRMLNAILDVLPCQLIVKDADNGSFLTANRTFCESYGVNREHAVGKKNGELFPEKTAEKFDEDDRNALLNGKSAERIERISDSFGQTVCMEIKENVVKTGNRRILVTCATDITASETAKDNAADAQKLLGILVDRLPVGLFLKDPDHDFQYLMWNRTLEEYTGASAENVVGKNDFDADVYPGKAEYFREQDLNVMKNREPVTLEEVRYDEFNGETHYQMLKIPVELPTGKRVLLGAFLNRTALERQKKELYELQQQQERLLKNIQVYNDCLKTIGTDGDYGAIVYGLLALFGRRSGAARCFLVQESDVRDFTDVSLEWTEDGLEHSGNPWREIPDKTRGEQLDILKKRHCLVLGSKGNFTEFGESGWPGSTLLLRIMDADRFWGLAGISFKTDRAYSREDRDMLENCVRFFLLAKRLAQKQQKIDSANHIREMIFQNIRIPIFLFDANGKMRNVNKAGILLTGKDEKQVLESACYRNFCGNPCEPENCPMRAVLRTGRQSIVDLNFYGKEMRIDANPIFDTDGKIRYVLETAADMTEINRSKHRLTAAMEAAQAADLAKSNFLATMNHELRTPLNAVIGFSEILREDGLTPEERADYLQAINQAGKVLLKLVNDILDISRSEGDHAPSRKECRLETLFEEMTANFASVAREKKIEFQINIPPGMPIFILNAAGLRQIMQNLLGNAVKFTRVGSVRTDVAWKPEGEDGTLTISVADTGIGIEKKILSRIFDPFVQEEDVRNSRAYQGSGLGLAVTAKLVERMGGTVTAESTKNIGSTFTVVLKKVKFITGDAA